MAQALTRNFTIDESRLNFDQFMQGNIFIAVSFSNAGELTSRGFMIVVIFSPVVFSVNFKHLNTSHQHPFMNRFLNCQTDVLLINHANQIKNLKFKLRY